MSDAPHIDSSASAFPLPALWDSSIVLKDKSVNVSGLSPKMVEYLNACQGVHESLFILPLCVTSGNDGGHAIHSKHSVWKAVDVRSSDVDSEGQLLFLMALAYLSKAHGMAVFDERELPGAGHFHVEEAG